MRPAVLGAVDILFDHERPALQSLAERDVLLVLDNCEHVVDEVADLVDRVLATGTGRLRVLATSQVRLGLGVERIVEVRPLDPEEALELFTARVHSVDPTWRVEDAGWCACGLVAGRAGPAPTGDRDGGRTAGVDDVRRTRVGPGRRAADGDDPPVTGSSSSLTGVADVVVRRSARPVVTGHLDPVRGVRRPCGGIRCRRGVGG